MPPIRASVLFRGSENSSFANFQSGRIALKILLCFTCPAITACVTPSLCSRSMALLNSPRLTQCSLFAFFSKSGEASSFMAITAISMPWLRAPSSTRNGKRPFPAISPHPVEFVVASGIRGKARGESLLHNSAFRALDKSNQFLHIVRAGQFRSHFIQRLGGIQFRAAQQTKRAIQHLQPFLRESFALEPDGIHAVALRLALRHHTRKRWHILHNHRTSPDIRVTPHAAELVHHRKRTDRGEILHCYVPRQRRSIYKQCLIANLIVMTHVRVRQKKVFVPNPCNPTTLHRSPVDGHILPKNISVADH